MKRDMKLIREILLAIEASDSALGPGEFKIEGYTDDQINFHAALIVEAGLAHGQIPSQVQGVPLHAYITRLTWDGCDFLDAARDESRWKKALSLVGEKAGSVATDVLKELLSQMGKSALGLTP
jgi:hypothetical protein